MIFNKPKREVTKVFLHCSASDNPQHDNVKTITEWHLARGFKTIGYHFYIDKTGQVHKARDLEQIPAAQKGHNKGSIAICCGGLKEFTQSQMTMLFKLCQEINEAYNGNVTFHGHKEVEPNKSCPVYDYKRILGLDTKGRLTNKWS